MNRICIFLFTVFMSTVAMAQLQKTDVAEESDYYYQIPDYPESYSEHTVAARVLDGLGFRFYWSSEALRSEDLEFKPTQEARSTAETIDHIYGLTKTIVNAINAVPNKPTDDSGMTTEDKRRAALANIKEASEFLKSGEVDDMEDFKAIFKTARGPLEYPFWNMLNGPIADAIYHTGQIVTLRRMSGNPINSNISLFRGKVRN